MADSIVELEGGFSAQINALLAGVEEARLAVFDAVREERTSILTAVTDERAAVMDELDEQMLSATIELDRVGRGLVDHFFLRLVQVLVLVGVFKILMTLLRRRRSGSDD